MAKEISQRQLRNDSGEVMRGLDRGEDFLVTRNGVAVGELRPVPRRRFVDREHVVGVFRSAAPLDAVRFRNDADAVAEQDPTPRA